MAKANKNPKIEGEPDPLTGQKIVNVRQITEEEAGVQGWHLGGSACAVIELENGLKLFPSRDPEGNGPGCLFGEHKDGEGIIVFPMEILAGM